MNPIRSALRNRSVVLVLTGFAVLLGVGALFTMPRREDPKVTIRTGLVLARYPGANAEQTEEQVTRKIEQRLFDDVIDVRVVLQVEKYRNICEIIMVGKEHDVKAVQESD